MQKTLHIRITVPSGGKVEFASPELGAEADGRCGGDALLVHRTAVRSRHPG